MSNSPTPENKKKSKKPVTKEDLYIIGIGASAGGLQALDALFSNIPQDSVSYVVVQHLGHEHKSIMKDLLEKHANLEIIEIAHDMEVEVNRIYILTERRYLTIKNGRLLLSDFDPHIGPNRTFDTFFTSLAADKGPRVIGVVLSGTGSDGTEGIAAIKRAGGLVIVQDPTTAKFEGMPNSAIASGQSDFILPPELMPEEIFNFVKVAPLARHLNAQISPKEEQTFQELLHLVREQTAIDFANYKRPTIIRRITRRMATNNFHSLLAYLDFLHLHPEEIEVLSKEFMINVTKFFRDEEAFAIIQDTVLPEIVGHKLADDQLRIWVAGCSSGEEAYSLAILVREHLDQHKKDLDVKIFASDIDREALEYAGKGLYPDESLAHVSPERLNQFFVREDGKFRVCQRVRKTVIFAPHNIITAPPFSKVDLVSCRNMLIYLNPLLQKKVLAKFHYALNVGGFLFLGSSESVGDMPNFVDVNKKWKIFRNTEPSRALGLETFTNAPYAERPTPSVPPRLLRDPATRHLVQHNFADILNEAVLDELGFAALFVDESHELLHAVGNYTKYINLPDRSLTLNLLKMVPADLSLPLGTLLRGANKERNKASARGVQVHHNGMLLHLNVVVKPFLPEKKAGQRFLLVLISEERTEETISLDEQATWQAANQDSRVAELELELQHTKEDLQSVVEELEMANEELQSTNEELLSSNEELQSTNEELQSLNEELHTINAEHQYKIKALIELDDDLNNYFRSTDISQIFVDRKLIIRKYTPSATRQINLIESDIGRSIYQISNNLKYDNLIEDLRQVINHPAVLEREVQDKNDRWYQMRILPYLTQDKQTDGAILIFQDITDLKNLNSLTRGVLDSSLNGIQAFRAIRNSRNEIADFELVLMNAGAERLLGRTMAESMGMRLLTEYPESRLNGTFDRYARVVQSGEKEVFENQTDLNGIPRWIRSAVVQYGDGCVITFDDVTDQRQAEAKLRASAARFQQLVEAFPQMSWTMLPDATATMFNQRWYAYTGLTPEESRGAGWQHAIHPDELPQTLAALTKAMETGNEFESENRYKRGSDGQYRWHLSRAVPLRDEEGTITQWISTATDIHELKGIQEQLLENQHKLVAQNRIISNILRNLPVILWRLDADGVIQEAIGSGLDSLRMTDNQIRGKKLADLHPPIKPHLDRVLAGETVSFLSQTQVEDTQVFKQNYYIHDDETGGAIGFCLDVTEQKLAEEEASYRNRLLDNLLANMPLMLAISDREGHLLEVRGQGLRSMGFADNELQGVNLFTQFPSIAEPVKQVLQGETLKFVGHYEHGGKRIYYQNFGFFDEQKDFAAIFAIEITESVLAQEKLKNEKEFTENLLENSIDGIVAFDRDTCITAWNKTMETYTGISRKEVLGKTVFEKFPNYQSNAEGEAVRRALQGQKTTLHDHPFGIEHGMQETITVPLISLQGEVIGGLCIVHDISENKRLEEERMDYRLTQQKDVLNAILETQEQERRRISEALHNSLGQLLYAAKLQVEETDFASADKKEQEARKKNIEHLLQEAIRETRTISFEMMPVILEDFGLETAVRELCKRLSQGSITLGCYVSGFRRRLDTGLEMAIYRIIQELINNIIKHAQAQEGIIHLERTKNQVQISVEDNGIGFEEGKIAKLKKGVGLNSIRNRLKLVGGEMTIQSRLGKGTIVSIEIPVPRQPEPKGAAKT